MITCLLYTWQNYVYQPLPNAKRLGTSRDDSHKSYFFLSYIAYLRWTAFPLSSSRVNSFVFKKRSAILFVLGKS